MFALKRKIILTIAIVALTATMPGTAPVAFKALKALFVVRSATKQLPPPVPLQTVRYSPPAPAMPSVYASPFWPLLEPEPAPPAPAVVPAVPVVVAPLPEPAPTVTPRVIPSATRSHRNVVSPQHRVQTVQTRPAPTTTRRVYYTYPVRYTYSYRCHWWSGGPVRRFVSTPFRWFGFRRCW